MDISQPAQPPSAAPVRTRNGLGVAALVIGVASVVAGVSFVLFPLALVGGLVGLILGSSRSPVAGTGERRTPARPSPGWCAAPWR